MGSFQRTQEKMNQLGFVRGPARLLAAPMTQAIPTKIGDVVSLSGASVNEVQTLTMAGTPTGGTFALTFQGAATAAIPYNATSAQLQSALDLVSTIGVGNTLVTGGPFPATPLVVTFQNNLAAGKQPLLTANNTALTGGTTPGVTVAETAVGSGLYDPIGSWFDLGGTKTGVTVAANNTETTFTIDQQTAEIGALPDQWQMWMQTALVENTPENIGIVWETSGTISLNTTVSPSEKQVGYGTASAYTQRRLAVIHRRPATGLLRLHFLRIVQRAPLEMSTVYQSTGEQQPIALRLNAMIDSTVADERLRFGFLIDQQPS